MNKREEVEMLVRDIYQYQPDRDKLVDQILALFPEPKEAEKRIEKLDTKPENEVLDCLAEHEPIIDKINVLIDHINKLEGR